MSKHPVDHARGASSNRLARFAEVERAERPSEASKTLQRRAQTQGSARTKAFARIEKEGAEG